MSIDYGPRALRGRIRLSGWERISYGLYAAADQESPRGALRAWSLTLPAAAGFTHLTAAEVRGWWLPEAVPHPVFAALAEGDVAPQRTGLVVSRHPVRPPTEVVDGIRVTLPAETLLAAARDLGVLDLVILGDCALRSGCEMAELVETAGQRRRGAPRLRKVIPLLDARSESPWESVMRVLHRAADIPVEAQRELYDPAGRLVARADLWIVGTPRLHEYDGAVHRDPATHRKDLARDRKLLELGIQRFGYTAVDLLRNPGPIIAGADRALGRASDPRRLRRWRQLVDNSLFSPASRARTVHAWHRPG